MGRRRRGRQTPADRRKLRPRALERGPRREPPKHVDAGTAARRIGGGIETPRDPEAVVRREPEPFRHHADDRVGSGTKPHRLADDVRIGAEAADPLVMTDHDRVRRARALVFRQQRPATIRPDAGRAERRRRDLRHHHDLGRPAADDQVALDVARHAEVLDGLRVAPRLEVVEQAQLAIVRRGVPVHERDQAITLGQRQLRAHHHRDDGEGAGGDRDADRHTEHADEAQARIAEQHAPGQREIERGKRRALTDPALALPLDESGADRVQTGRKPEGQAGPSRAGGELAVEGIDHLHAIEITVAAGKGAQRKLIQTRHFGPPNMFCARATSRSARSRSDSARATARPKLVRW